MLGSLLNSSASSLPTFMKNSRLRLCVFRDGVQNCVCVCVCVLSHSVMSNSVQSYGLYPARLFCPWDSPGMELPCLPPGDLPDPGIEPVSLMSPTLGGRFFTSSTTWEAWNQGLHSCISCD